jgi:hypothetical protein
MKHNFTARLIVLAATSLLSSGVFSQLSTQSSLSGAIASADNMALASLKGISEKMYKHFSRNFKHATDIKVRPEADHTQVTFKDNTISESVQYNKNGKWQYSMRTYDSENLPKMIRNEVEVAFPGYQVFGFVNEIDVLNKSATLVMIENKDSWKRVRLVDNTIDVYEEYRKAK